MLKSKLSKAVLSIALVISLCLVFSPQTFGQVGSILRRLIGTQDISWATGGSGAPMGRSPGCDRRAGRSGSTCLTQEISMMRVEVVPVSWFGAGT